MNDVIYFTQLNICNKKINIPDDNKPVSPTEKLVRQEIKKLNENTEEIKRLKEQVEKSDEKENKK